VIVIGSGVYATQRNSLALGWLLFLDGLLTLDWGSLDLLDDLLLLGVGVWNNLGVSWETELLNEELNTGVGEEVVGPSPVVDLVEVASGLEGLDDHHDVEVHDILDLTVLWKVSVLLDNNNTLSQDVLEDSSSGLS